MTIGAVYVIYEESGWLSASFRSVYPAVDYVLFLVGDRPWHGTDSATPVDPAAVALLPDPDGKVEILRGAWATEVEQRNFGMAVLTLRGLDYCLIVDDDEVYDTEQLRGMAAYAAARPGVGCWHLNYITYWKSARYRIHPIEPYHPPVLLKVGSGGFVEYRNPATPAHELIPPEVALCHHLSYARSDERMLRKITTFSHAPQVMPGWYDRVWLGWDRCRTMTGLHPVDPPLFGSAVEQAEALLPPALRDAYLHGRPHA